MTDAHYAALKAGDVVLVRAVVTPQRGASQVDCGTHVRVRIGSDRIGEIVHAPLAAIVIHPPNVIDALCGEHGRLMAA